MLGSIKPVVGRGLSIATSAMLVIVMLPIALVTTAVMMLAGMIALSNVRRRLQEASTDTPKGFTDEFNSEEAEVRSPIEGSYTKIE